MRAWLIMLGGLIVWAAHFVAIYAVASVFPGQATAQWLVAAASAVAIAADVAILRYVFSSRGDALDAWTRMLGRIAAGLSLLAVIWQTAPAALV